MAEETGKGLNGNEYATKVFQHFAPALAKDIATQITEWMRTSFGTGFCAGIAFAKALPLKEEIGVDNG